MTDVQKITRKRLGELLVAEGIVSQAQVEEALRQQERTGELLGEILVKAGYTGESDIAHCLCTQFAKPFIRPSQYDISREVLALLPPRLMAEHLFIPLDRFGNLLTIAIAGLLDAQTLLQIQKLTGCDIEVFIATASEVKQALMRHFPELYDPITMEPRYDRTAALTQGVLASGALASGPLAEEEDDMGETTREIVSLGEEDSDWEALFEEAEQKVLRELKQKRRQQE
ncbi:MAG: hypothetical protein KatS3mg102_1043 [Planctomycetota bacterium]|nr:MAG: hypothetical protein KatS3mg102_1043 [Planctomycetota bacterium]